MMNPEPLEFNDENKTEALIFVNHVRSHLTGLPGCMPSDEEVEENYKTLEKEPVSVICKICKKTMDLIVMEFYERESGEYKP